jgi:hypothetical protein
LLASYGPPINASDAAKALPYALMLSQEAPSQQAFLGSNGWIRLAEWQDVFRRFGYTDHQMDLIERTGFHATVYGNERTGSVIVVYGLNDSPTSPGVGGIGNFVVRDIQLKAAADLAWLVRQTIGSAAPISLTAGGSAASLARYAGEQAGISQVVTFGGSDSAGLHVCGGAWMCVGWVDR